MNKFLGKMAAGILVIAFIITGSCLFGADAKEVYAAGSSNAFHTESLQVNKYIDGEGNRTAPKPTASGYEDWIFAGWYRDADCTQAVNSTSGTRYAKFVPSEVLSVKCQVTAGTTKEATQTSSLRLISTVDSLNYNEVGFEVSFDFGAQSLEIPTYNVFKRIESSMEGQEYGYSPNIFDLQSEYFVTATLTNIDNDNFGDSFYIRPYWKTLDGTKVYGVRRCARVEDSYLNIVNVPVRLYSDASVTGGSVSVAYNTTNFTYYGYDDPADLGKVTVDGETSGTVKVAKSGDTAITADGMFVNLRLQRNVAESSLPKKNQFTVTSNLTVADSKAVVVPNVMHTHYHTTYNGTPDTSWYQNGVLKYVITSPAELYGVASLAEKTNFYGVEIYLGADIKINDGTVADWKAKEPTYKWEKTIGTSSLAFNGTFDGQGHSISGIYLNSSSQYVGLFGLTEKDSIIKDFKLVNSYFKSTAATWVRLGSIVGDMRGKSIDTVYSNAVVEAINTQIGGLIGGANAYNGPLNVTNCQFDGEVTQTIATEAANQYVGGIAGVVIQGTVNFTDCLNTGKVSCVYTTAASNNYGLAVGGLLGSFMNAPTITFTDCLNSGTVMTYNGTAEVADQNGVGSVVGFVNNTNVTINCNDTYATAESTPKQLIHNNAGTVSPAPQSVAEADISSYLAYSKLSDFGFYKTSTDSGRWVTRRASNEKSTPVLKSFVASNEWFDASWYLDNSSAAEYEISTLAELYAMAELTIDYINFGGKKITLTKDIIVNVGDASNWSSVAPKNDWTPIGTSAKNFNGTFDGGGHTISGLYVHKTDNYAGLFGVTTINSIIQNLRLENSYIKSSGYSDVGSIAGLGGGSITNVYSNAVVQGSTTSGNGYFCGGLVGRVENNNSTRNIFTNCWFDGKLTGYQFVGGILGIVNGNGTKVVMENCVSDGNVTCAMNNAGGICGAVYFNSTKNVLEMTNCVATGKVRVGSANCNSSVVGHVVGTSELKLTNVYTTNDVAHSNGTTAINKQVDGIGDNSGSATFSGDGKAHIKTNLNGAQARYNTALDFYLSETDDGVWVAREGKIPSLKMFVPSNEWYTEDEAIITDTSWYDASKTEFVISTAAELYGLSELSQTTNFYPKKFYLGADICINQGNAKDWSQTAPVNAWTPMAMGSYNFNATLFDGQGHTISGIYVNTSARYVGLFGVTTINSNIQNLKLENSYIKSTGYGDLGSIAGLAGGTFTNVYSNAIVEGATTSGAGYFCGGLVGRVENSNSTSNRFSNCWFNGKVTGYQYVGGILGIVNGSGTKVVMENCLSDGEITCALNNAGGICGSVFYNGGKSTLEMTDCLVAGRIRVGSANCNNSVVGHVLSGSELKLTNVYTINDVAHIDGTTAINKQVDGVGDNSPGTISGDGKAYIKTNLLGAQARYNTALDFYLSETDDGVWVARKEKTPALKMFVPSNEWYTEEETIVADKSWYDANKTDFVISTAAELYGLSELSQSNDFSGKTVKLGADIYVNQGSSKDWGITAPINAWNPIGVGKFWKGTLFDGQGHTISGLYTNTTGQFVGLFGVTQAGTTIQNLNLVNSYFESTYASTSYLCLGGVVGYNISSLNAVYCDAIIVDSTNTDANVGGLVGRHQGVASTSFTMNNCWFNGTVTSPNKKIGGILGTVILGTVNATGVLFTGTINSTYVDLEGSNVGTYVGGICGYPMNNSVVNITNCISAGRIYDKNNGFALGTFIGRLSGDSTDVNITNGFAGFESGLSPFGSIDANNTNNASISNEMKAIIRVNENDRLIGFGTEEAGISLDLSSFKANWTMREEGVPVPSVFATNNMKHIVTPITDVDAILALSTMDSSWTYTNALNAGLGHYVLTTTDKTYEQFTQYLKELKKAEHGFVPHVALDEADKENVSSVIYKREAGEWVLNIVYSAVSKEVTLTISNGFDGLSENLKPLENVTQGNVIMSMPKLTSDIEALDGTTYQFGNSFIFKLPNQHFVINDGGALSDFDNLIAHLKALSGVEDDTTPIIIDAWTVTHQHGDHFDVIRGFLNNKVAREQIRVNAFYINEPNRKVALCEEDVDVYDSIYVQYKGMRLLRDENNMMPNVYWCQTGQTYYFCGLTMYIVQSQEQILLEQYGLPHQYKNYKDYNTASTSMIFATANGKKIYITGDLNYVNMQQIIQLYGNDSDALKDINIYQAPHHGKNTSMSLSETDNTFSEMLVNNRTSVDKKFDVVLFPASLIYGVECTDNILWPGVEEANQYLINNCKNYYDYETTRSFELGDTITLLSN